MGYPPAWWRKVCWMSCWITPRCIFRAKSSWWSRLDIRNLRVIRKSTRSWQGSCIGRLVYWKNQKVQAPRCSTFFCNGFLSIRCTPIRRSGVIFKNRGGLFVTDSGSVFCASSLFDFLGVGPEDDPSPAGRLEKTWWTAVEVSEKKLEFGSW